MDRRVNGQIRWAVLFVLAVGSGGCSTLSESLPVPEPAASLSSFQGPLALDLTRRGRSLPTDSSAGYGGEVEQDESKADRTVDQPRSAAVTPAAPSSVLLAQVKPSQAEGSGDLLRDPEPVREKDEPYDPFQKEEDTAGEIEEYDPWEPFNQAIFTFNRKLDEYVLKPVATVYDKVIPDPLEFGIRNVFHNIRFAPRFFNNLAQGKFKGAGIEAGSFLINTTFGLGGLFDFAKDVFGLETPDEDTGQTLGVYGAKPGPYLVLPFLGSFTLRDGIGFIGDLALDPFNWLVMPAIKLDGAPKVITKEDTILFGQLGTRAGYMVNERSLNIETTFEGVEEATVDLYGAVRNAYLQKRAKAIKQ